MKNLSGQLPVLASFLLITLVRARPQSNSPPVSAVGIVEKIERINLNERVNSGTNNRYFLIESFFIFNSTKNKCKTILKNRNMNDFKNNYKMGLLFESVFLDVNKSEMMLTVNKSLSARNFQKRRLLEIIDRYRISKHTSSLLRQVFQRYLKNCKTVKVEGRTIFKCTCTESSKLKATQEKSNKAICTFSVQFLKGNQYALIVELSNSQNLCIILNLKILDSSSFLRWIRHDFETNAKPLKKPKNAVNEADETKWRQNDRSMKTFKRKPVTLRPKRKKPSKKKKKIKKPANKTQLVTNNKTDDEIVQQFFLNSIPDLEAPPDNTAIFPIFLDELKVSQTTSSSSDNGNENFLDDGADNYEEIVLSSTTAPATVLGSYTQSKLPPTISYTELPTLDTDEFYVTTSTNIINTSTTDNSKQSDELYDSMYPDPPPEEKRPVYQLVSTSSSTASYPRPTPTVHPTVVPAYCPYGQSCKYGSFKPFSTSSHNHLWAPQHILISSTSKPGGFYGSHYEEAPLFVAPVNVPVSYLPSTDSGPGSNPFNPLTAFNGHPSSSILVISSASDSVFDDVKDTEIESGVGGGGAGGIGAGAGAGSAALVGAGLGAGAAAAAGGAAAAGIAAGVAGGVAAGAAAGVAAGAAAGLAVGASTGAVAGVAAGNNIAGGAGANLVQAEGFDQTGAGAVTAPGGAVATSGDDSITFGSLIEYVASVFGGMNILNPLGFTFWSILFGPLSMILTSGLGMFAFMFPWLFPDIWFGRSTSYHRSDILHVRKREIPVYFTERQLLNTPFYINYHPETFHSAFIPFNRKHVRKRRKRRVIVML